MESFSLPALLSHPFTLLITGALLSSLLIPSITRRWQDHKQELELKAKLAGQISEGTTTFMMAIQFAVVEATGQKQEDYDAAYRTWQVRSAVTTTMLEAYFPETRLAKEWEALTDVIELFYASTGIGDARSRMNTLALIRRKLAETAPSPDDDTAQTSANGEDEEGNYRTAWLTVRSALLAREAAIIRRLLQAPMEGFSRTAWWRRRG
jgi:hypothetical protein